MCREPDSIDERTGQLRLARGELAADEAVTLSMRTGSMAPLIPAGSTIEVTAVTAASPPRDGDVVVFRRGTRLVAHRLLLGCAVPSPGWFLERGDGVSEAGLIRAPEVLGRVIAVRRPDGARIDLTTPAARRQGLRTARRTLYRLVRETITRLWRKDRT